MWELVTFNLVFGLKKSSGALYSIVPTTCEPIELVDIRSVSLRSICCSDNPKSHSLNIAESKSIGPINNKSSMVKTILVL